MSSISQSASQSSIAEYLRHVQGVDAAAADAEAAAIIDNFERMKSMGYIKGWCFDEGGHLDLIPSDTIVKIFGDE
ncbi:hypothetical protein SAMN04488540_1252 [Ferrimonas sediminum]|uniref:Uncharacterized protein n=1 Tax=Ferrimonas sediminum TaxID=718193 RepID=A0A1G9ARI3_9GAMM|nr:hypothetical protein [Ferrimonas sediminum]SDK29878.1 hypothetical protein SAMN04488540_1252 [Ferrimonas sediminum]